MVFVIKGGLRQQVSEEAFKKLYEPNGWVIDAEVEIKKDPVQETIKTLKNEAQIKNYIKMTGREPRKFDDKLFKNEETG